MLLFTSAPTQAQESQLSDLTSLSVEDLARVRLSTASRYLTDPRKAPASITSIDAEEIKKQGWRTLGELLRSVPGFYTAYDRTYTYLGVRGFLQSGNYNARVLLLVDGHRMNENIYDSALIGTEFPLDMSNIDHVEILRGPGSSLFGTNAELAVVNVFTRRPGRHSGIQVSSEARSQLGRLFEAGLTFRLGRTDGLISGSMFRSNGVNRLYFPEFDSPMTNYGVAENLDGDRYAHIFGVIRSGQLRIEGAFGKRDKIVPTASFETIFAAPSNRSIDTRSYIDARYSRQFGLDTDLELRVYYDAYRFYGSYPYEGDSPGQRVLQINASSADWGGFEAVLGRKLGAHRIVAGASGEYNFRVEQQNYYLGQPPFLDDHRRPAIAALFGEAELNPKQWLSLNLGGRVDKYSSYGTSLSPRAAVMFLPTPRTTVKYVFARAFLAPDPYNEFYVNQINVTTANPHLRPETIATHTIIFQQAPTPWLKWAASAFRSDLDGTIEESSDPVTGETKFVNEKGDSSRGLEFELTAKSSSNWTARTSYVFTNVQEGEAASIANNAPTHVAKFAGIAPLSSHASLGLETLFTSRQTSFQGSSIGSSFLTNGTLSTSRLGKGWELSASCYNLFDRRWSTPTGPEVVQSAIPQDGRTLRFRITYRWDRLQ